jgi:REP element-mobilizing transposase RayT
MTAPRQVLPGTCYLVTRRCAQRQFLLRPSKTTNAVFLYVLAVAAKRFGIRVHAYCVLSNHFHAVVSDPDARLPAFKQFLDSLVARALNASLGRWEAFWAPSSYSAVTLLESSDVVDKTAYVLANPVAAGLVRSGRDWPGLWSAPEQIGAEPIRIERPTVFFRPSGPMPESIELALTVPPGFASVVDFRDQIVQALAARERESVVAVESQGRQFLGARRALAQAPSSQPNREEPRRVLNPRVAGRDKWKRIEALGHLVAFRRAYRAARRAMLQGVREVVFPEGTYWLRVAYGVRCGQYG